MLNVIDSIDFDDVFESTIFEDEWLVPTKENKRIRGR